MATSFNNLKNNYPIFEQNYFFNKSFKYFQEIMNLIFVIRLIKIWRAEFLLFIWILFSFND